MAGLLARLLDEALHPRRGTTERSMEAEFGPTFATRHARALATIPQSADLELSREDFVRLVLAREAEIARASVNAARDRIVELAALNLEMEALDAFSHKWISR